MCVCVCVFVWFVASEISFRRLFVLVSCSPACPVVKVCTLLLDRYFSSSFFVFVVDRMAFVCECVEKCTIRFAGHIALLTRFVRRPDFNPRGARLFKFLKRYVSVRLNVCVCGCVLVCVSL